MSKPLPAHLYPAYDWTSSAGELEQLVQLTDESLDMYCRVSAENARQHDETDVSVTDLAELAMWLREHTPLGRLNR